MPFLIKCLDKKNSLSLRLSTRDQHLKYLKKIENNIILAGPILNEKNDPSGTILILDFDDEKIVKEFLKNDPYNIVKLFKSIEILRFKKVM